MIDRVRVHVCLRGVVLGRAALVALGLCLLVPALALLCVLVGCLVWLVLELILCLGVVLLLVLMVGGGLGVVGGGLALLGGNDEQKGAGLGAAVLGAGAAWIGWGGSGWWWANAVPSLHDKAVNSFLLTVASARWLCVDLWAGWLLWLWPWLIPLAFLIAAGGVLVGIGLLWLVEWLRFRVGRIRYACPVGHRSGAAFACSRCGAWEPRLSASIHGVIEAVCAQCGNGMPTSDWFGRLELPRRCHHCHRTLTHPDLGRKHEFHVAIRGPAGSDRLVWLTTCVDSLRAGGSHRVETGLSGSAESVSTFMLAGPQVGAGLLYLEVVPDSECVQPVVAPAEDGSIRAYDACLLVLTASTADVVQRAVEDLLEYWERQRPGRSVRRCGIPLAVVGSNLLPSVRTLLEARFERVAFFKPNPDAEALAWIGQQLARGGG